MTTWPTTWPRPLRVLDLFSCIGGHALGLDRAHPGAFVPVAFVEVDPWRRRVLAKHWPGVPIHDDVRTFTGAAGSADVIVGGPPCGATSIAGAMHGKRTGATLWPEMLRIVGEVRPRWVVVEQPPGNAAWTAACTDGLARTGYGTCCVGLSAGGLGAPHLRRRMFVVAHADGARLEVARSAIARQVERAAGGTDPGNAWGQAYRGRVLMADGVPAGLARRRAIEALGDSNPPQMMTVIGRAILGAERGMGTDDSDKSGAAIIGAVRLDDVA